MKQLRMKLTNVIFVNRILYYEEAFNYLDNIFELLDGMLARKEISSLEFQVLKYNLSQVRDAIDKHGSEEIE